MKIAFWIIAAIGILWVFIGGIPMYIEYNKNQVEISQSEYTWIQGTVKNPDFMSSKFGKQFRDDLEKYLQKNGKVNKGQLNEFIKLCEQYNQQIEIDKLTAQKNNIMQSIAR